MGFLVIAVAVGFDTVALLGLQASHTTVALALGGITMALALVGWWLLPRSLRRFPQPVAWIVTFGLALSTAATGLTVPTLAVQTAGYLLVIPGIVALVLPWRTVTHVRWLLAYTVVAVAFFMLDPNATFTAEERGDLVVVLFVALGASLAGHVLLQRSQIRSFAQLESIRGLQRRAAADMIELELAHHALELTARTDPLTGAGNRRRLEEDLRAVRAHINRSNFTYGLAAIDLDRFKAINDIEGHAAGDEVLCRTVQVIQKTLRANDAVYRLGGEEFLVILSLPERRGARGRDRAPSRGGGRAGDRASGQPAARRGLDQHRRDADRQGRSRRDRRGMVRARRRRALPGEGGRSQPGRAGGVADHRRRQQRRQERLSGGRRATIRRQSNRQVSRQAYRQR